MAKVALITGSARGIGRAIALRLAEQGFDIIVNSRTCDPENHIKGAVEVTDRIREFGQKAYICTADISTSAGRANLIKCAENIGRVDILVNNAGIEPSLNDMLYVPEEEFDKVIFTNLKGPFFLTREIARRMIEWKKSGVMEAARIVFITSLQAQRISGGSSYCMSKAALHNAIQQFAVRLGTDDIPVIEIVPGVIPTDMSLQHKENIDKKLSEGWALTRRWGKLEEMANMVAAVADGLFDYSTGSSVQVSGGMNVFRL